MCDFPMARSDQTLWEESSALHPGHLAHVTFCQRCESRFQSSPHLHKVDKQTNSPNLLETKYMLSADAIGEQKRLRNFRDDRMHVC